MKPGLTNGKVLLETSTFSSSRSPLMPILPSKFTFEFLVHQERERRMDPAATHLTFRFSQRAHTRFLYRRGTSYPVNIAVANGPKELRSTTVNMIQRSWTAENGRRPLYRTHRLT